MTVRESIVQIGSPLPLAAVLTEVDDGEKQNVALVLVNSGIMHRVGSCRLSVRIARAVTEALGLPSIRFDFSGIGDSEARRGGGVDFDQAAVKEVIEVMDHLQKHRGISRFILYGLCSGALICCRAAAMDHRVIGVAQVDGYCYPTLRSYVRYYSDRLISPEVWRERVSRWFSNREEKGRGSILTASKPDFEVPEFARDPGRGRISRQLQDLMSRKVQLHCVFAGRDLHFYYSGQYQDCFSQVPFGGNLSLEHYPRASHIFTEPRYQRQMVRGLVDWVERTVRDVREDLNQPTETLDESKRLRRYRAQQTPV